MIKKSLNKLFGLKLKMCDLDYRLKGYTKLNSIDKNEYDTPTHKLLQVYLYLETQNKKTAFYSLLYSVVLISSLVVLL